MSTERAMKMEALLDELAPVVDGEREALERHADFLADDDHARDLRYEATEAAELLRTGGADFVVPEDLEARFLAALDAQQVGRKTQPGPFVDGQSPTSSGELPKNEMAQDAVGSATLTAGSGFVAPQTRVSEELVAPSESDAPGSASASGFAATEQMPALSEAETSSGAPSEASPNATQTQAPRRRVGNVIYLFGALGLAAAAAAAIAVVPTFFTGGSDERPIASPVPNATTGRVELVARAGEGEGSGLEVRPAGGEWSALLPEAEVPAGATLRTDERTRARVLLSDGTELVLNHSTEILLDARAPRHFDLRAGEILADVAHLEDGPNARFEVPTGAVEVLGTKFVLAATTDVASVRVTRGTVRVEGGGQTSEVKQGEEGILRPGALPEVAPILGLARSVAWAEIDNGTVEDDETTLPGIGSLRARRPGERTEVERPLGLARHDVRVRIVGNVAYTEIEEVFRNDSGQVLEGIYRFPLPADARIARLALEVDGALEEGAFVARERAARIWRGVIRQATPVHRREREEEFIWVPGPWRDPALLEWQRGGSFDLHVYPIPAHGERRVVLAYTQVIRPEGRGRRYVYPMAHSSDDSTRVGEMHLDVRVAGATAVRSRGYDVTSQQDGNATELSMQATDFRPNGDLIVDYELPGGESEVSYWTYRGDAATSPPDRSRDPDREVVEAQRALAADGRGYVALSLRPRLPARVAGTTRDYVLVVDSSQSMVGERFQRAAQLVAGVVAEMDRRDRFTVLACDYECRSLEGTAEAARMRVPTGNEVRELTEFFSRVEPAGASDLVATLRAAASAGGSVEAGRERHILYFGDGVASVGHRDAGALGSVAETLAARGVRIGTVGVGQDADSVALEAIARAGGGHFLPFVPGQRASLAALSVLETTYGVSLREPTVTLPEGLSDQAPSALPTVRSGEELLIVARMDREEVRGDVVLRGNVGGQPFEQRYQVQLTPSSAEGNRFVPQLWAASTIGDLELAGRGEDTARIVAMSKAYRVLSRHTSLLVLESERMFRAFGVDREQAPQHQWTGSEEVDMGTSEGSVEVESALASLAGAASGDASRLEGESADSAGFGGLALGGAGRGGGGAASAGGMTAGPPAAGRRARASATTRSGAMDLDDREAAARPMPDVPTARRPRGAESPAEERSEDASPSRPDSRADFDAQWQQTVEQQRAPAATPVAPPRIPPRGRPGSWMRREYFRTGRIERDGDPTFREQETARRAEESLSEQPDSRDRHRLAVRALARAGNLERALEVAEGWAARDRLDPEALIARADLMSRMGRRAEALRLLTGVVDLRPEDVRLHERLADAFDRFGQSARACAHRVALAEIQRGEADAVGAALRCERDAGERALSDLLLASVREERIRDRAERIAGEAARDRRARGDLIVEASWSGGDDVDLTLVAPDGSRLSWMGGRTTVVGDDANASGRETLGLRWAGTGSYLVEVSRTNPDDHRIIRGQLRIRVLGESRSVPFVLDDGHASVSRITVRRESRMVPVSR